MKPQRIQLSRKKGWRMPPGTIKVCRPGKWGNPFRAARSATDLKKAGFVANVGAAVALFAESVRINSSWQQDIKRELRGKNLACFCKIGTLCHADVLLEIANS